MLEYREFPIREAIMYMLFSPSIALCFYYIYQLTHGALFLPIIVDHLPLLGIGALAAAIALPLVGKVIDRVHQPFYLAIVGSILPPIAMYLEMFIGSLGDFSPGIQYFVVTATFLGLTVSLVSLTVLMGRTIVIRFRGRITVSFLAFSVFLALLYPTMEQRGIPIKYGIISVPEIVAISTLVATCIIFQPWKFTQAPLAVVGNVLQYFVPMVLIMASYMLWYFNTKLLILSDPNVVSLVQEANLGLWEYAFFIGAIGIAGITADHFGRKASFSFMILLMSILSIFSSVFLYIDPVSRNLVLNARILLLFERSIEGYFLGLCLLLIWTELGSAKTKGFRVAMIWFFFLGYVCLFWAVDLEAWGWSIPTIISSIGREMAIFLTLVALYISGHLPEMIGREMEMEDLQIEFDDREVERTVESFLGEEDFEAVRHQLEILDVSSDLSDEEIDEILGEKFTEILPLRRVPGIGTVMEDKLQRAGYTSAAQLAGETPKKLSSKVPGLGLNRARKIIEAAREVVQRTLKGSE